MELTRPFAENGDRQDFPVDTQGDGSMSLQQGFGAFYGLPPEEGGLFIQRPQFNQLMYLVSKGVIDNKTAIKTLKSEYNSLSTSSAKLLTENLTWTVGTGGKFSDINSAIIEANKYIPINDVNSITIKIADGFVISEQIKPIVNPRLNVFLTSENRNVNVDCRTFTVNLDNAIALFEGITSINLLNIKLTLLHFNTKTNLYAVFGGGAPSIWHKGCEFVDFNILYEGGTVSISSNCTFYYTKFVINQNKKDTYIFRPIGINMCLTIWGGTFELSDVKVKFTITENGSTILSRLNPTVNNNNTQSSLWVVKDGGVINLEYDISPSSTFNGTKLSQPKNQLTANGYIVGK